MRAALRPLSVAPFGRLFTCYTVNHLGDFVGIVALALLVYGETGDALATSALFAVMEFAPSLMAPALTARLDQIPPRVVLPVLYVTEGLLFALLALLAESFALWAVLVVAFIDGVLMLTARGLVRAAINETLTPVGLLREGNGLINVGFALATVGGTALGGVLVGAFDAATALYIDAASFIAVGLLLATASTLRKSRIEAREPLRTRLRSGLGFVYRDRVVRLLVGGETIAVFLFSMVVPVEVVYATETLGTDEAGYGLLLAAWGAGAVLGSVLFVRLTHRSPAVLIVLSTSAIGLAYLGMGLSETLNTAVGFSALGGIGNGVQWVAVMTAVQEATPAGLQARVAGLLESLTSGVMGVGFMTGGALATLTAPETCFVVAGVATLSLIVVAVGSGRRISGWRRPQPAK